MIQNQKELLNELKELKNKYNVVGIKSSFEDEGVQFNELIRLKQLCNLSNIIFNVKIGGCEAISDINNCMLLDADGMVAPMVESPFALEKFITSVNNNVPSSSKVSNTKSRSVGILSIFLNGIYSSLTCFAALLLNAEYGFLDPVLKET